MRSSLLSSFSLTLFDYIIRMLTGSRNTPWTNHQDTHTHTLTQSCLRAGWRLISYCGSQRNPTQRQGLLKVLQFAGQRHGWTGNVVYWESSSWAGTVWCTYTLFVRRSNRLPAGASLPPTVFDEHKHAVMIMNAWIKGVKKISNPSVRERVMPLLIFHGRWRKTINVGFTLSVTTCSEENWSDLRFLECQICMTFVTVMVKHPY